MPLPTPTSVANMDPVFENRLQDAQAAAAAEFTARNIGGQVQWNRPADWAGDTFDYAKMHASFDRSAANSDCLSAISDAEIPGVTGDVVASTAQIDELSIMERALKARYTLRRCRATAHMLGRKRGQGDDRGPYIQLGVEYIRNVLKQAKDQ